MYLACVPIGRRPSILESKSIYMYVVFGTSAYVPRAATCNPAHVYLHVQGLYVHVGLGV